MPRNKTPPKKLIKISDSRLETNTWVFLMKNNGLSNTPDDTSNILKLRHPASSQPAMFMFDSKNEIHEVLTFDESKRSWFIDNNVKSDGKLYLSTPIDPIFLILPYLRKSQQAQLLDQCLWDQDFLEASRLTECKNLKLELVADRRGDETLVAYKFNEEKTLAWLQDKVEKVIKVLKQKNVYVSQGAISATFTKSDKLGNVSEIEYVRYAHGIVSEYLEEDLSSKLAQHLNIPEEAENKKRKARSPQHVLNEKRFKNDALENEMIMKSRMFQTLKAEKKATIGKKELARQKAATGSKSITTFFKKQ